MSEDVPWLVKSSGRILGPFPSAKIIDLLRSREISVLDEVSAPLRRWQTLQYHPEFKETVENLRRSNVSDKTEATWTPSGSITSNLTQTLTDIGDAELTEEISDLGFSSASKEIVIHNVVEHTLGNAAPTSGRYQTQQGQNTAIQRQVEKTTRGLWIVTMTVLLGVGAFIVQRRLFRSGGESRQSVSALKQAVMSDVQTGQYAAALRELKAFYPDPLTSGEMAIYYGSLLIQVDGQTVVGRRVLQSVISAHRPDVKQAYTSEGIADLLDSQLDSAQENFDRALAIDTNYTPAIVNSAMVALRKGDYNHAKTLAVRALHLVPQQGEAILALAEAQLYLFKNNGNLGELNKVGQMIKEFRASQWDFASEIGFYNLYYEFLRSERGIEDSLREYLEIDPQLTADHRHSVFIFKGFAQWKVITGYCEQMAEKMGDSARVATLLASCYSHEGRWDQARMAIEKAVQQSPKDALIQAWFSYVLKESSEVNQASVVLGHSSEFNRKGEYVLPIILQGRFCAASEELDCARDSWQRLYEHDVDYLPAVSGLAWVFTQKGSRKEALKYLQHGLKISPDYIPLLQLQQKAEKEGWYAAN